MDTSGPSIEVSEPLEGPPPDYDATQTNPDWLLALKLPVPPIARDEILPLLIQEYKNEHAIKDALQMTGNRFDRYSLRVDDPPLVLFRVEARIATEARATRTADEPWDGSSVYGQPTTAPTWGFPADVPAGFPGQQTAAGKAGRVVPRAEGSDGAGVSRAPELEHVCIRGRLMDRAGSTTILIDRGATAAMGLVDRLAGPAGEQEGRRADGVLEQEASFSFKSLTATTTRLALDAVDPIGNPVNLIDHAEEVASGKVPPMEADDVETEQAKLSELLLPDIVGEGKVVFDEHKDFTGARMPNFIPVHFDLPTSTDRLMASLESTASQIAPLNPAEQWNPGTKLISIHTTVHAAMSVRVDAIKGDRDASPGRKEHFKDWMRRKGWIEEKEARWKGMFYLIGKEKAVEIFTNM